MDDTDKRRRVPTQAEISRVLSAAKKAGLKVSACIVKGQEIRVITKGAEALADTFDSVDFSS
jgi:hypothetical protein